MGMNASLFVQEEFRAKRRKVFPLRSTNVELRRNLSFRFVIGTAVRDCAQMKNISSPVRKPTMGLCAMITS